MALRPSMTATVALCLTASAALFFLGTGLAPLWVLAWLAPIPALWLAPRLSAGQAFCVAAAAYALGALNVWFYSGAFSMRRTIAGACSAGRTPCFSPLPPS